MHYANVKETELKMLCTILFPSFDILGKTDHWDRNQMSGCHGLVEKGLTIKDHKGNFEGDGNIL